jgi:DNA sulfur modification protein DndE
MKRKLFAVVAVLALMAGTAAAQQKAKLPPAQVKATEDWSYSLALQAATWGSPAVIMYALRDHDATGPNPKAAPNSIWRMENTSTPELAGKAGYVLPNLSVIYGFGFMDLSQEPVVMTMPDSGGLYYMVETSDMWTNAFAYPAGAEAGYKGGKVAFVGPGWKGELPRDVKRIDCPTPWILIQPRVHLPNQSGLAAAQKVLSEIKTQGLAEYLGKPALPAPKYDYAMPNFVNPKLPVSTLDFKDPLQFWEIMSAVINENPPPQDEITALLPMFKPLGIELGKKWDRSKVDPIVLKEMARAAEDIPKIMAALSLGHLINGWYLPVPTIGAYGKAYDIRAWVARNGLTGNTPKETVYFLGRLDGENNPITGAKKYTMTFKQTPPFNEPAFWALRMYDATNYYPVPNPINRYVLGSDYPDMKKDPDGSVTIYLQHMSPGKDKEANWLPAPAGPFLLVLGTYAPGQALIDSLTDPSAYAPPPAVVSNRIKHHRDLRFACGVQVTCFDQSNLSPMNLGGNLSVKLPRGRCLSGAGILLF